MSGTFLQKSRHQTVYYFRRKIPIDLRGRLGASPIFTTLRTRSRQEAAVVARRLAVRSDELFHIIRSMSDTDFKNTPLGRLIAERKVVAPLKEEIDALRDQLVEADFQKRKTIEQMQEAHLKQLAAVVGVIDTKEPAPVVAPAAIFTTPTHQKSEARCYLAVLTSYENNQDRDDQLPLSRWRRDRAMLRQAPDLSAIPRSNSAITQYVFRCCPPVVAPNSHSKRLAVPALRSAPSVATSSPIAKKPCCNRVLTVPVVLFSLPRITGSVGSAKPPGLVECPQFLQH